MANFYLFPEIQFQDNTGAVLAGGLISTFQGGTSTPQATFTDSTGGTPNANPVVLDSAGRCQMWLSPLDYKFVIKTSGGTTLATIDHYNPANVNSTVSSLIDTGDFTMQQATAATGGANQSSKVLRLQGQYWNGAATATDEWDIQDVLGSGTNPTSTLSITHSGSPGTVAVNIPNLTFGNLTITGNETIAGTLGVTGKATFKNFEGIVYADQFTGTSFNTQIANAIAALPATGAGIVDCTNMTNLTMDGNLSITRSNTCLLFGQYTVTQGSFSIGFPSPTSNIAFIGQTPLGGDPSSTNLGTRFVYTGTGSSHTFGDTSATSYNHRIKDVMLDISGAGNAAIALDSSRVYHTVIETCRVLGKTGVNTQIGIRNNGTTSVPGSQNMLIYSPYISNCFIGVQGVGGDSPPSVNMNQIIGGEITGPGSGVAGSIGINILNGNNNNFYGAVVANYETALKVTSPSGRAVYGDIHIEGCTTAINFVNGSNNNWIFTDTGNAIVDGNATSTNTVIGNGNVIFSVDGQTNKLKNSQDKPVNFIIQPGSAADQFGGLVFRDRSGNNKWNLGKLSDNSFSLQDASGNNILPVSGSLVALNAPFNTGNQIAFNVSTNAGTGGVQFFSGGASPVLCWKADSAGITTEQTANGGQWIHGNISENLTLNTGGTTTDTSANLLPANSIIEAVCARITTTITTATDWKLGDSVQAARFTAAIATLTAGTTTVGLNQADPTVATANLGPVQVSAAKVRVTTTGTPGAGAIRITVFYRQFVAPTS